MRLILATALLAGCDLSGSWFDGWDGGGFDSDEDGGRPHPCLERAPIERVRLSGWPGRARLGEIVGPIRILTDPPPERVFVAAAGLDVEVDGQTAWVTPRTAGRFPVTFVATDYCTQGRVGAELQVDPATSDLAVGNVGPTPLRFSLDGQVLEDDLRGVGDFASVGAGGGRLVVERDGDPAAAVVLPPSTTPRTVLAIPAERGSSLVVLDDADVEPPDEPSRVSVRVFHALPSSSSFDVLDPDDGAVLLADVAPGRDSVGDVELPPTGARLGLDLDRDGVVDLGLPPLDGQVVASDAVRLVVGPSDGAGVVVQSLRARRRAFADERRAILEPGFSVERTVEVAGCGVTARIDVRVRLEHPSGGAVRVVVVAPEGVARVLAAGEAPGVAVDGLSTTFTGVSDPDLLPGPVDGSWTLRLVDQGAAGTGWFSGFEVVPRCLP